MLDFDTEEARKRIRKALDRTDPDGCAIFGYLPPLNVPSLSVGRGVREVRYLLSTPIELGQSESNGDHQDSPSDDLHVIVIGMNPSRAELFKGSTGGDPTAGNLREYVEERFGQLTSKSDKSAPVSAETKEMLGRIADCVPTRLSMVNLLPFISPNPEKINDIAVEMLNSSDAAPFEKSLERLFHANASFIELLLEESEHRFSKTLVILAWGTNVGGTARGWISVSARLLLDFLNERKAASFPSAMFGFFAGGDESKHPIHPRSATDWHAANFTSMTDEVPHRYPNPSLWAQSELIDALKQMYNRSTEGCNQESAS
ncbi:DUF1643 domain-containing protein [Corynebacterium mendelii]|uniref:DUF1643 domain-containing protein n=1 Tax=Corynebacterium mendelii TaxID=2765362 RepID=A0A939DYU9_9CORY|nr:DUF1643 domain-containing protein [Corynebacterium mendelii]MBN9643764.1 DUF1643 domain-containing protein [Corynebacterium mendelii]